MSSPFSSTVQLSKELLMAFLPFALPEGLSEEEFRNLVSPELWERDPQQAAILAWRRSGCFDETAYLQAYPDIARNGMGAIEHYVRHGYKEERLRAFSQAPKVSVLVPVYNNSQYLHECIDSILNQTLRDIEIIIIDDGSTDPDAIAILDNYAKQDNRITVIHKHNTGYGHSMNVGLHHARGEYIAIVESDDYILKDMFEQLYIKAKEYDLDFIKADFFRFDHDEQGNIRKYLNKLSSSSYFYNRLITPINEPETFNFPMNTWSGIYSRKFILKHTILHNETPGASFQDNGFWFQTFSLAEKAYFIDKPYYMNRRDNPESSVFNRKKIFAIQKEFAFIEKKIKREFPHNLIVMNLFHFHKYKAYMAAINRSDASLIEDFISIFRKELITALQQKEIDFSYFKKGGRETIFKIINSPHIFCEDCRSKQATVTYKLGKLVSSSSLSTPKISIIIPVYNEEKYISACLDSIINQTIKDFQIICIDDGSTDRSIDIIKQYTHNNKIIIKQQHNRGSGAARNYGLSIAEGEFIAFMDADDFYPSNDILELLYKKAKEYNIYICGGSMSHYRNGEFTTTFPDALKKYTFQRDGIIEYKDYQFDYGYQRFIYRKSFLQNNKLDFPDYLRFQDPPFFVKAMIAAKNFYALSTVSYCYRRGHAKVNWTDRKINDLIKGCTDILKIAFQENLNLLYQRTIFHLDEEFRNIILQSIKNGNTEAYQYLSIANTHIVNSHSSRESGTGFLKIFKEAQNIVTIQKSNI